jgi:predicted metalloprotease with PDZ domain
MRLLLFFCLNSVFTHCIIARPMLSYNLFIKEPQTHYVEVEIQVDGITHQHYLDFKMPVWTPGSYLVREFSKNVEHVQAFSGDQKIGCEKINKNTWRVYAEGQSNIVIKYNVYAFKFTLNLSSAHVRAPRPSLLFGVGAEAQTAQQDMTQR